MPSHENKAARFGSSSVFLCLLLWAVSAGATSNWNVGSGNWSVATNWTPAGVPGSGDVVNITNSDAVSRTITYDFVGSLILGTLTIGNSGGGIDTVSMSANLLQSTEEIVGESGGGNGAGAFNQSGGANTITSSGLFLGFNSADTGTYNLSGNGATLSVTGQEIIGYFGTGSLNQSNGTNTVTGANSLYLGDVSGSNGTYTLSGSGILSVGGNMFVGIGGIGNFNDSASPFVATVSGNLFLGYNSGSTGTMTIANGSAGTMVSGNAYVGGNAGAPGGKGALTVSAGLTVNGTMTVYNTAGTSLALSGGFITTQSLNLSGNSALFNWSATTGGSLDLTSESITIDSTAAANFGDSAGSFSSFNLSTVQSLQVSGSETVGFNGAGTFAQTGSNTVGTNLFIGYNTGSIGLYTLADSGQLTLNNGSVYVGGNASAAGGKGTLTVAGFGSLTVPTTGTLTVYNTLGSGLSFTGGTISTGSLNLSGNTSLFNWTAGSLRLTNQSIIIDSTPAANFGDSAETFGAFTLSAAQSLQVSTNETIGYNGTASFTQTGGTNSLTGSGSIFYLGYNAGSTATYTLSGAAVLSMPGGGGGGEVLGYSGTGIFNQTGGTNVLGTSTNTDDLLVGGLITSTGTYTLSGSGALQVFGIEAVGVYSTGTFTQTGGTNTVSSTTGASGQMGLLAVGYYAGSSGTYNLSGGTLSVNGNVDVGGNGSSPTGTGTGVLNVSSAGVMTVTGTLTAFATTNTSIKLNGGTINAGGLDFNGVPSLFNWTTGTLNLTSNVTWDSAAANTTTSDAFLNSLTLASNQTLMVTGNETIGGTGSFSLTLNSGGTHYVTGSITLNPTGTLTQNAGSTLYYSTFTQAGGTINGTLQNQGAFVYQSGLFNGRLLNQGSISFGSTFTLGNGVENDTIISMNAGQTLTVNGAGLDNLGTFNLDGGVISGAGPVTNDYGGTLRAYGTINPALTNDGTLTVPGVLRISSIANYGTVEGNGAILGTFSNTNGGTVSVAAGNSLAISSAWTNSSVVALSGTGATLGGGTITNTGTIQGVGTINSPINNTTGVIRASGGELQLAGADTNAASAQIQSATGNTVLVTQGLATNAGLIALAGGTFDNNNQPMSNTGTISGNGTLFTGSLTNSSTGLILLTNQNSTIYGPVTNNAGGNIKIVSNTTTFYGAVTNNGTIKVTAGVANFLGNGVSMTVGGTYNSDPSQNYFNGLATTPTGLVTGGAGNEFVLTDGSAFNNAGTFNDGGTLSANAVNNSGAFTQTGTLIESGNFTNSGSATIGGTQTWSPGTIFTNTAGAATFQSDAGSASAFNLSVNVSGGKVVLANDQHWAGLNLSASGALDINNYRAFINYGSGPDPIASIAAWIASGYAGGTWNGTGIMSTAAQTNSGTYGIGYADAADPNNPAGLAPGQIEIMYTLLGDANLDGKVNGTDFAILATNFNQSVSGWDQGDFNYDNKANGTDFAFLASNFNQGASQSADLSALDAFAAANGLMAEVPEPASIGILAVGATGLMTRRWRA